MAVAGLGTAVVTAQEAGVDRTELPKGKSTVKMDFAYDGGGTPGEGGTVTLYINGKSVGSLPPQEHLPQARSSQPATGGGAGC